MTQTMSHQRSELLESLHARLQPHFPKEHSDNLKTLIHALFKHASMQDLLSYEMTDLAGLVVSMWRTLQGGKAQHGLVNVFNPNVEEHEWQSPHTIVSILHSDLPFIIDSVRLTLNRLGANIHTIFHASLAVSRNKSGQFDGFSGKGAQELLLLIEVDRTTLASERDHIESEIRSVVQDVERVVEQIVAREDRSFRNTFIIFASHRFFRSRLLWPIRELREVQLLSFKISAHKGLGG